MRVGGESFHARMIERKGNDSEVGLSKTGIALAARSDFHDAANHDAERLLVRNGHRAEYRGQGQLG